MAYVTGGIATPAAFPNTSISATASGVTGANLVGLIAVTDAGTPGAAPTWDGRSMTLVGSALAFFGISVYVYAIDAPTNGTISCTGLTANAHQLAWAVFDTTAQSSFTRTPATGSDSTANASVSATSVASDDVVDFLYLLNETATAGAGQTARGTATQDGEGGRLYLSTETAGGTSTTMSWAHAATSWGQVAVALVPAAGGGPTATPAGGRYRAIGAAR